MEIEYKMENAENCRKQHFCNSKTKQNKNLRNSLFLEYLKVKLIIIKKKSDFHCIENLTKTSSLICPCGTGR